MQAFARSSAVCALLLSTLFQVAYCDANWPPCDETITSSCIKIVTVQPTPSTTTITTYSTYTPPWSKVFTVTRPTLTTVWTLTAAPGNYGPIDVTVLDISIYADETTTWTTARLKSDFSQWDATRSKPMSNVDSPSTSMPTSQPDQSSESGWNALSVLQQAQSEGEAASMSDGSI